MSAPELGPSSAGSPTDGWTDDPATWPPRHEQRRAHWRVEHELRERLLASSRQTRDEVTRDVYNELFRRIPWHIVHDDPSPDDAAFEDYWFQLYAPLARPTDTLVDLGCGDGHLVRRFAPAVHECVGIDASDDMVAMCEQYGIPNARFVVGSVIDPPLETGSADLAISRQVMEHLHPDDVPEHLAVVRRILRPGGRFLIETPSRLTGPWDISRGITPTATGFHLREYTHGELAAMLRRVGFDRVRAPAFPTGVMRRLRSPERAYVPAALKAAVERAVTPLPPRRRRQIAKPLAVGQVVLLAERRY